MRLERLANKIIQVRGISFNPRDISDFPLPDYVPILKANNIKERGLDTSNLIYIHRSKVKPEQFIKKGDLLLAASSGSKDIVGKNIFFEDDFDGSFGAFCKLVRPNEKINSNFLGAFFKTPIFKRHIRRLIQGALINNLKNEHIDSLQIPSLSFSNQHLIANILSKAETLIEQRKQSIDLLDEFLKSAFSEMFGNTRKFSKNDIVKSIGEICFYRGGGTPSKAKPEYFTGNIPWVSPKDMKFLYITTSKDKITQEAVNESSTTLIPRGAVLMVIRSGILKNKLPLAINKVDVTINQDMKAFSSEEVSSSYLLYFFFAEEKNILKKVKGTTADNLNFDDIKKLKIKIPPIELQNKFDDIVNKTETLKDQYRNSLQELKDLYGSISQQSFKGELKILSASSIQENLLTIAAEPITSYKGTPANHLTKDELLQFYFICLNIFGHQNKPEENTLGEVKMEKTCHLAEYLIPELQFNRTPVKEEYGPADFKRLYALHNYASENNIFFHDRFGKSPKYPTGEEFMKYVKEAINAFRPYKKKINALLDVLRPLKTNKIDILATTYAAWNNLIILKKSVSLQSIATEGRWHARKKNFTDADFQEAIDFLTVNNMKPEGKGKLVLSKD